MSDYNDFESTSDYESWCEVNSELIRTMLNGYDTREVIYAAYFAGYCNGLDAMAELRPLTPIIVTDAEQKQLDKLDDSNVL
jgi:hypothetical protein